jgi:short-subunit dehydrogenase
VRLSHAFLAQAQRGDALINVSSTLAFLPMATFAAYSATKAFVTAFSEALWYEQKERGVYVMGLCPGLTSSDFQVNAGGRVEDLPRNLIETPEQVVATALRSLRERKDPTVISGAKNAIFAQLMTRLMPRKTAVNIMGAQAAKSSP